MEKEYLIKLEKVNELRLSEDERARVLAFFDKRVVDLQQLEEVETSDVTRMVHVMPIEAGIREDVAIKKFARDDLQKGAPETTDGYWQVPRLVEQEIS